MTNLTTATALLAATSLIVANGLSAQDTQSEEERNSELAKKSQNPLASIISLPFQNNTEFNVGPTNGTSNTFNIQPVYPVSLKKFNIINRAILPVEYESDLAPSGGSVFGLGDLSYTAWASPTKASKVVWGVGPSFVFPTATDARLGSGKWSAGVGAVVLATPGKWVLGGLAQNVWSFAGDADRSDVNFLLAQYFINYNFPGFYLTSAPIIIANWEAASGQQWTVPFGGGAGKIVRWGSTPLDVQFQVFYNVIAPDSRGDWGLRLMAKALFVK